MKKKFCNLLCIAICILVGGCSNQSGKAAIPKETKGTYNLEGIATNQYIKHSKFIGTFKAADIAPIFRNKVLCGYLKLDQITKVGISDWKNTKALKSGIKFSYSLNFNLDFTEELKKQNDLNISGAITMATKTGKIVGETTMIGWTGFPKVAQLYSKDPTTNVELGLQPYINSIPKKGSINIQLTDSIGGDYDPIVFCSSILNKRLEEKSVLAENNTAIIKSINGAVFEITMKKAYLENHPKTNDSNSDYANFIDFSYNIKYVSEPTKDKEVGFLEPFKGGKLLPNFVMSAELDTDTTKYYDSLPNASRATDNSLTEFKTYVTKRSKGIRVGESITIWDNRVITNCSVEPKYVRFCFEFPEEVAVESNTDLLSFNGRYVIFQLELDSRKLKRSE